MHKIDTEQNIVRYALQLNINYDKEIIDRIEKERKNSMQGFIKRCIIEHMQREKKY